MCRIYRRKDRGNCAVSGGYGAGGTEKVHGSDILPGQKYYPLTRFLNLKESRDQIVRNMTPIIPDIFEVWDMVETTFADKGNTVNRVYRKKKMARYEEEDQIVNYSLFGNEPMNYVLPKGLIFPIVAAFRALVKVDKSNQKYSWRIPPKEVWEKIGGKLINIIMTSSEDLSDNPDAVAKSPNTWDLLFKEVLIYSMRKEDD